MVMMIDDGDDVWDEEGVWWRLSEIDGGEVMNNWGGDAKGVL